jgi:hypothetical protein
MRIQNNTKIPSWLDVCGVSFGSEMRFDMHAARWLAA